MRKISKGNIPKQLAEWIRRNPKLHQYEDLEPGIRQIIREACTKEQFYLCAYCCRRIDGTNRTTVNEHIIPRHLEPKKQLDFNNIVASCNTKKQCDDSHSHQELKLTPLMEECEKELKFLISGDIEPLTDRAKKIIQVLNLRNNKLIEKRKNAIFSLLCEEGIELSSIIEDKEILESIISDLKKTDQNGKLKEYSPVVINILSQYLQNLE